MIVKSTLFGLALACIVTDLHAGCPYITPFNSLKSQEEALYTRFDSLDDESWCTSEGKKLLNEIVSISERLVRMMAQARAVSDCNVDDTGKERERIADFKKLLELCRTASPKPSNRRTSCATPPSPATIRRSPFSACFVATNTNGDSRCVFSFNYTLTGQGLQLGGNVGAGESTERCSQKPGVDITFGKWTSQVKSAQ